MPSRLAITAELRLHLHLMLRYRRWGEKLAIIPLLFIVIYVGNSMLGNPLLRTIETHWGLMLFNGGLLILWGPLLVGLLASRQIYLTALIAFGVPRALGYLLITTIFALLPGYFLVCFIPAIYWSILVFPLWLGIYIVPSLLKEEIHRKFGTCEIRRTASKSE